MHGNLRLQGGHQGGTKEEHRGHILGVRPSVNIWERQRKCFGWGARLYGVLVFSLFALLNPIKHFPEPGLPCPSHPLTTCQLAAKAEPGRRGDRQGLASPPGSPHPPPPTLPFHVSYLFLEGHSRNPSA